MDSTHVIIIFLSAWGMNRHRMQKNGSDANRVKKSSVTPANPEVTGPSFVVTGPRVVLCRESCRSSLPWSGDSRPGDEVKSSPAVVKGKVYFGASDKYVYSLDLQTGKQLWSKLLDDGIEASPTVVDDMVYIGTLNGTLYAWMRRQEMSAGNLLRVTSLSGCELVQRCGKPGSHSFRQLRLDFILCRWRYRQVSMDI